MKKILLKRLALSNWRSLNSDVTFGEKTKIFAYNGVGKTSLQSAWNWLLSSYTSANEPKNHNLYDNRMEITQNTPVASVKAWIEVDGIEYTIEKRAKAKFSRKRGTNEWVKDSADEYTILIDGIETSATDYASWLEYNICDTHILTYCLDGSFFSSLVYDDKKQARKMLETIVGNISEGDLKGDYDVLSVDFAKGYTIEQIEEKTKNQLKDVKKHRDEFETLLRNKENALSEYANQDFTKVKDAIEECKAKIEKIDAMILNKAESIKPILGERNALFEIINSKTLFLNEYVNTYLNTFKRSTNEIKGKISEINTQRGTIEKSLANKKNLLEQNAQRIKSLQEYRDILIERRNEIKGRIFNEDKCAYCGQELPYDLLEDAKKKFNERKQEDLNACIFQGKNTRDDIDAIEKSNNILEGEIKELEGMLAEYDVEKLENKIKEMERDFVPCQTTDEYKKLRAELDELNDKFRSLDINQEDEVLNAEKKKLMLELEDLYIRYGFHKKVEELKDDVCKLHAQIRACGIDMASLEGVLDKCKEYIEERADVISQRVNESLKGCKIRMWERQKNGDIVPACIITDANDVKLATTNTANRMGIYLSLQDLFCKYCDITLPKWIDEAAVFAPNNLPKVDGQSIMLFPSEDKVLRIENN